MTNSSPIKTIFFVFILFLALTGLIGAGAPAAQAGPSSPASQPPPTEAQRNDTSIPPLTGGIPATPKTAVDAPRGRANPGTRFQDSPNAPVINVWYGPTQTFGPNGDPQKWINVVGNVAGAVSLTYSLNGGPTKVLAIGPNNSRLANSGDFNIELDYTDLNPGNNAVNIVATDNGGGTTTASVTVNYQSRPGAWTPGTYTIDWSTATKINDVAQVVDGNWILNAGNARPAAATTGFDRLIAIGDMSWRDYTVTVPVTVHTMDLNKSPGVGLIVRWLGHFDNGAGLQPIVGWKRLGAMAWYRYEKGTATEGLQLLGDGGATLGAKGFSLSLGTTYMYKVSITSNADPKKPATYRFKVWPQAQAEPATWDFELAGISGEPRSGSIVLVAHHADVSFGNVTINLASTQPKPELKLSTMGTGGGSISASPQKATYRFGEDVTLTATPDVGSTFTLWQGDAGGTTNPTAVEMFTDRNVKAQFTNPSVQTPISDDFNGCVLDSSLWTFVNPLSDSTLAMTGGHAEISVPAGTTHDLWTSGRNAPRIMQFTENSDFEFIVKFDSTMSAKNQAQGVLVEGDAQNYLRYNFLHDGSNYKLQAFTFTGGSPTSRVDTSITISAPMYLKVKRLGDVWNLFHSADGTNWGFAAGFSYSLAVSSVGVYAGNSNANPAHTAKVDYFFNTKSPISPEDNARKLNVAINGNGTVQRSPDKENYACDEVVTLTPIPAQGYKFDSWSGALTGNTSPAQLTMNATKDVVAKFVSDTQYTLTLTANGAGTVTKSPQQDTYAGGTQVTLTAMPALGNTFVNWLVNGVPNAANPLVVTVNSNMTVVGNFVAAPARTLTVTPNGNGTITKSPDKTTYLHGEQVTLTANPGANAGFVNWSGAATGTTNPIVITMDADKAITANFADNVHTLTVNTTPAGGGTVTVSPAKAAYYNNEVVTLTPVPAAGYVFVGWSGALTGSAVPGQLTMTKNSVVTATFISDETFTVNVSISGDGTVMRNPSKTEFAYGEVLTLTAIAGPGSEFINWSGDLASGDNPATITVTRNMNITANFGVEGIYSLTILPSANGTVNVTPVRNLYAPGEQVTLTPMPDLGYMFTSWGNDGAGSTANPLVLTMDSNITISAAFETAPLYTLNVTANGPGTVATDPAGAQFMAGSTVTLTATAESGYVFTGWSGDLVSGVNPYSLLMNGNKNIVANFGESNDVVSDDFAGCGTLNPMWTWVDPLGQAEYALTGTQVRITVPPNVDYEIWKDGNNSARLMQEVANTDFELQVRIDSSVTRGAQSQGVVIETDDDTFVRVDFYYDGTTLRLYAAGVDNGSTKKGFSQPLDTPATPEISLRVQRIGDTWRVMYRLNDAEPWVGFKGNSFRFPMFVERVGIFAASQRVNNQATAPGHTALFDFFFNGKAPILNEDANAPGINVTVAPEKAAGTVTLTPSSGPYTCGQQVQLVATPAVGWRFFSWSQDLNGSDLSKTITVSKKHDVTANFVRLTGFKTYLPVAIR